VRESYEIRTLCDGTKIGLTQCRTCRHVGPWHALTPHGWECQIWHVQGNPECDCTTYDPVPEGTPWLPTHGEAERALAAEMTAAGVDGDTQPRLFDSGATS
jgi:hypothetical protein